MPIKGSCRELLHGRDYRTAALLVRLNRRQFLSSLETVVWTSVLGPPADEAEPPQSSQCHQADSDDARIIHVSNGRRHYEWEAEEYHGDYDIRQRDDVHHHSQALAHIEGPGNYVATASQHMGEDSAQVR